jgi:hypothetical protein
MSAFTQIYITRVTNAGNNVADCPCGRRPQCAGNVTEKHWLTLTGTDSTDTKVRCTIANERIYLTKRTAVPPAPSPEVEQKEPLDDVVIQHPVPVPVMTEKKPECDGQIEQSFDLAAGVPLPSTPEEKKQRSRQQCSHGEGDKRCKAMLFVPEGFRHAPLCVPHREIAKLAAEKDRKDQKEAARLAKEELKAFQREHGVTTRGRGGRGGRGGCSSAPINETPVTSPVAPSRGGRGRGGRGGRGRAPASNDNHAPVITETPAEQSPTGSDNIPLEEQRKLSWE